MVPTRLVIHGLYAYKTQQVIDFQALIRSHIFGIFGAVGSGKSSILDAITFALYGEIERITKRDGWAANIFNQASEVFLIRFEFETGNPAEKFRFEVHNARTKKGEPKSFDRRAYQWKAGEWLPLAHTNAEEIFHLSYENFKRTIIIPQGRFQEFLTLTGTERTQMMLELFPKLSEFDLQEKTNSKKKATELELAGLEGQLAELGEVQEEELILKQKEIDEKTHEVGLLEVAQQKAEARFQELELRRQIFTELTDATQKLEALQIRRPEFDEQKKKVERFGLLEKVLLPTIQALSQAANKLQTASKAHQNAEQDLEKNRIELQQAKEKKEHWEAKDAELPDLKQQAQDWENAISWNKSKAESDNLIRQQNQMEARRKQMEELLVELKSKYLKGKNTIAHLQKQVLDPGPLAEVRQLMIQNQVLEERKKKIGLQLVDNERKIEALKAEKHALIAPKPWSEFPELAGDIKLKDIQIFLAQLREKWDGESKALILDRDHLLSQNRLFEFATELAEGKPCPLCGSTEHPQIVSAEDVSLKLTENERLVLNNQHNTNALRLLEQSLATLIAEVRNAQILKENLEKQAAEADKEFKEILHQLESNPWKDKTQFEIEALLANQKELQINLENAQAALQADENAVENAVPAVENLKSESQEIENKRSAVQAKMDLLAGQMKLLALPSWENQTIEAMEARVGLLRQQIQTIENAIQQARQQYQILGNMAAKHLAEFQIFERQKTEAESDVANLEDQFRKLTQAHAVAPSEIEELNSGPLEVSARLDQINAFFTNLRVAESKVETLSKQAGSMEFDLLDWEGASEQKRMATETYQQAIGNLAVEKRNLADLLQRSQKLQVLKEERRHKQLRLDNLLVLSQLFMGKGFVNYVSSVYLRNIVEIANDRFFRLTRQRLRLVLDGQNNFLVKDYLNNGHERLAKTLSGGQTFQAALCLALALADSVKHLTQSEQNFFFLDEGFGALDKEALGLVFDTLRQLRHENRIVGVISHIEEMQAEIGNHLKIRYDEALGSVIESGFLN